MPASISPSTSSPSPNATALLMQDTRLPTLPRRAAAVHYPTLAAFANAAYCLRHGYTLLWYHLAEGGCAHPRWGRRHPSFCKLAAIASAMADYAQVLWIDSDAWMAPQAPPLPRLAQALGHRVAQRPAAVSFSWDLPFSSGPNAGLMLWRASRRSRRLLCAWWHVDPGRFGLEHDYEQRTLHWAIAHLDRFRGSLETLQLRAMVPESRPPIAHVMHSFNAERYWRLGAAVLQLAPPAADARTREAEARLVRAAHDALELNEGRAPRRSGGLRTRLRNAVHAAMRRRRDGGGGGGGGGGDVLRGSHLRVVHGFNASAAALRHIRPPRLRGSARAGSVSLLEGSPLSLRNCSDDLAPWQRWEWVPHSQHAPVPLKGVPPRDSAGLLRLASMPSLCVQFGPARSFREPTSPLAQLARCDDGALPRSALLWNASTSALHSARMTVWQARLSAATRDLAPNASLWPEDRQVASNPQLLWPGSSHGPIFGSRAAFDAAGAADVAAADVAANAAAAAVYGDAAQPAGTVVAVAATLAVGAQVAATNVSAAALARCSEAGRVPLPGYVACRELHRGACDLFFLTLGGVQKPCVPARGAAGSCVAGRASECAAEVARGGDAPRGRGRQQRGRWRGGGRGGRGGRGRSGGVWVHPARRWRQLHSSPTKLFGQCESEYQRAASRGENATDKRVMDCERWCKPLSKTSHCRMCKCRACASCAAAPLPTWATGSFSACSRFGQCDGLRSGGAPCAGSVDCHGWGCVEGACECGEGWYGSACNESKGNAAGPAVAWRREHALPDQLWKPCFSEYQAPPNTTTVATATSTSSDAAADGMGDKKVQDCEPWCKPASKLAHCRYCKCRACRGCHNVSLEQLPEWALDSFPRCVSFGKCDDWNDKLGEWRRHSPLGGARCNASVQCGGHGTCRLGRVLPATLTSAAAFVDLVGSRVSGDVGGGVGRGGGAGGDVPVNGSVVRLGCRCEGGYVGERCTLWLDQIENEKVERTTRWCLSAWRDDADDGAPVSVTPCRRFRTVPHQQWQLKRADVGGETGLHVTQLQRQGLCLTAMAVHAA